MRLSLRLTIVFTTLGLALISGSSGLAWYLSATEIRESVDADLIERARLLESISRNEIGDAARSRVDDIEQPDASVSERTSWLSKNSVKYQLSEGSRLIGKYNYAASESSMGDYYSGDYTEAVLAYAYRPADHDRLNTLLKYTYFYDFPAAEQLAETGTAPGHIQRSHRYASRLCDV